jgi:hypothetical protein
LNISTAVPDIVAWLKGTKGYQSTGTYQTIRKHYSEDDGKSLALRLLIHYVGDYHQPLHCMNRVDDDYPTGDAGGNDFALPNHYDVDELHALWDTVIYEIHKSVHIVNIFENWSF